MAVPMTSSIFKSIVEDTLNKVFEEEYGNYVNITQYETEVDFEETAIPVSNIRDDDDTI